VNLFAVKAAIPLFSQTCSSCTMLPLALIPSHFHALQTCSSFDHTDKAFRNVLETYFHPGWVGS